jgi:hypothetical protein
MARKGVQNSETRAEYSKPGSYQPDATAANQPQKKISRPDFSGLSPTVQAARQLSLDFGAEQAFTLIHGGHAQHVAICQKAQGGKWHEKMVSHDMAQFAAVAVGGASDCYLSQNGFTSRNRRIQSLQALTSCWVDLDYYKIPQLADLSPAELMDAILIRLPWLPRPSALVSSGQGAYFEWVFDTPLPAERLDEWQAVMDALAEVLEPIGADWNAKDAARVLRIVGTVNSKSGRTVTVLAVGKKIRFETFRCAVLDGLAQVRQRREPDSPAQPTPETESSDTGQHSTATAAQRAQSIKPYELALARLIDYRKLAQLRGNPKLSDYRHRMLFCFAVSICWFVSDKRDAIAECEQFAADYFANPKQYTARRIGSVLERFEQKNMPRIWNGQRVANRYKLRNASIIRMLEITPAEQQHMKTLIDGNEKQRRRVERRRAAGMVERAEYLTTAQQRRDAVAELRLAGKASSVIAAELGMTRQHVNRIIAAAQGDLFE